MKSIAIVNDEANVAKALAMNFMARGYEVRIFHRSDLERCQAPPGRQKSQK
jgi:hypothetical protein